MKKVFVICFFLSFVQVIVAQVGRTDGGIRGLNGLNQQQLDSVHKEEVSVKVNGKTKFSDYRVITHRYDTTYIDTTLNIKKEYKFNFLRKDNFGLIEFHNQGQTFNRLFYDFSNLNPYPDFGFRAKHFNYLETEDIKYYKVPTPTTEVLYRTGLEQGQVMDALLTLNFSERLNVSLAYKGLRSLGKYRNALVSSGNFRSTFNYQTRNKRYFARGHIVLQDIKNQENGGLPKKSIENFETNNPNFTKRGRIDVNLDKTNNLLEGKRYYLDHNYKILSVKKDSVQELFNFRVGHELEYENKFYEFNQSASSVFLGLTDAKKINEKVNYRSFRNRGYVELNSKYLLGKVRLKSDYRVLSYTYDSIFNKDSKLARTGIAGKSLSVGGEWVGNINKLRLKANVNVIPGNANLAGNLFSGEVSYKKDSVFYFSAKLSKLDKAPNYNFQLFQSSYEGYNWNTNFKKINTQNLTANFLSKWVDVSLSYDIINNYVYLKKPNDLISDERKPVQSDEVINYFKGKVSKEFTYGKFSLNNTVLYQNVFQGDEILPVPELVTRNTLYFTDEWFRGDPLLVNIGVTFNYFTEYYMNAYNPLLSEFTIQKKEKISYPTFDLFFNARVIRTRIFLKVDNVTSSWSAKKYYSAPSYPYRDFTVRFGVVWNWFI